jgi:hypothetical protein
MLKNRMLENLSQNSKILIMDDEIYFMMDTAQIPSTEYYHCQKTSTVPRSQSIQAKIKISYNLAVKVAEKTCTKDNEGCQKTSSCHCLRGCTNSI